MKTDPPHRFSVKLDRRASIQDADIAARIAEETRWPVLEGQSAFEAVWPDLNRSDVWAAFETVAGVDGATADRQLLMHAPDLCRTDVKLEGTEDGARLHMALQARPSLNGAALTAHDMAAAVEKTVDEAWTSAFSVQNHGCVLTFGPNGALAAHSANASEMLGRDISGLRVSDVLASRPDRITTRPIWAPLTEPLVAQGLEASLHRASGRLVVEITEIESWPHPDAIAHLTRSAGLEDARTATEAAHGLCEAVRTATGFDRVMVVQHEPDGVGVPVAEAKARDWDRVLYRRRLPIGIMPPASATMFQTRRSHHVYDHDAPLHAMVTPAGDPVDVDLAHARLRIRLVPHTAFVRQIGVRAHFAHFILVDGAVWGMLVAYHRTCRRVSIALEQLIGIAAGALGAQLERLGAKRRAQQDLTRGDVENHLVAESFGADGALSADAKLGPLLLNLLDADGVAVRGLDGDESQWGRCPGPSAVETAFRGLGDAEVRRATAYHALRDAPDAADLGVDGSVAALSCPIGAYGSAGVAWFRRPQTAATLWAFDPSGKGSGDAKDVEEHCTIREGLAEPWSPLDHATARRVGLRLERAFSLRAMDRRPNEDRLRAFAMASAEWFFEIDADGRITFISEGAREIFGPKALIWARIGEPIDAMLEFFDARSRFVAGRALFEGHVRRDLIVRLRTPSGGDRRLRLGLRPSFDNEGRFAGCRGAVTDVTTQERNAEQLRLLKAAVDASGDAILITDASTEGDRPHVVYANEMFCAQTGYALEEVIGRNPKFLRGPETEHQAEKRLAVATHRGEPATVTITNYKKSGDPFRNSVSITPVRDENGHVAHFVSVQRDVTESELAARELRANEERLQHTLEAAGDGVWDWSFGLREMYWSTRVFEILGLDPATFRPTVRAVRRRIHPDDRSGVRRTVCEHLRSGAPFSIEFRIESGGGQLIWVAAHGKPLQENTDKRPRVIGRLSGIEDQVMTRRRIARVERAASIGFWRVNLYQKTELQLSSEAFRILDLEETPQNRVSLSDVAGLFVDQGSIGEKFQTSIPSGETFETRERVRRRNGDVAHVVIRGETECDPNGRTTSAFGIIQDVTEQILQEERLRQAQKMETVGRLAGGMAHDFNNVLGVILANLELLERGDIDENAASRLVAALEAAEKGAELTRSLLAFSRRRSREPEDTDLVQALDALTPFLRGLLPDRVAFSIVCPESPVTVRMDPSLFDSAIMNLVANARDAMPNGGTLEIAVVTSETKVTLTVTDTGFGIDADTLAKVREPFFTTKTAEGGTGLGLSMVENFAVESGAVFELESAAGQGAVARLTFERRLHADLRKLEPSVAPMEPQSASERLSDVTVVLVEDNEALREVLKHDLVTVGASVRDYDTADDAFLADVRDGSFDILVTDVDLPGRMSGVDLALAAAEKADPPPVILMSGHPDQRALAEKHMRGWMVWLTKPFRGSKLVATIHEALDAKRDGQVPHTDQTDPYRRQTAR